MSTCLCGICVARDAYGAREFVFWLKFGYVRPSPFIFCIFCRRARPDYFVCTLCFCMWDWLHVPLALLFVCLYNIFGWFMYTQILFLSFFKEYYFFSMYSYSCMLIFIWNIFCCYFFVFDWFLVFHQLICFRAVLLYLKLNQRNTSAQHAQISCPLIDAWTAVFILIVKTHGWMDWWYDCLLLIFRVCEGPDHLTS